MSRRRLRLRRHATKAFILVTFMLIWTGSTAFGAQNTGFGHTTSVTGDGKSIQSISLASAGVNNPVTLTGPDASRTVSVNLPQGTRGTALIGKVTLSLGADTAALEVASGSDRLGVVDLNKERDRSPAPFIIPLSSLPQQLNPIALTFTDRVADDTAYCRGEASTPTITVDGLAIQFRGTPLAPTTIDTFFPPVLPHLRIWLSGDPTEADDQAALSFVAAFISLDPSGPTDVKVFRQPMRGLPDVPAYETATRDVVIGGLGPSELAVRHAASGSPLLVVRGDRAQLAGDISVINSAMVAVVQKGSGEVGGVFVPAVIPPIEQTLVQLGAFDLNAAGDGILSVPFTVSQSSFGGMVKGFTLRLDGGTSPAILEDGSLTVTVNGDQLYAGTESTAGSFHLRIAVPARDVLRSNSVTVSVNAEGPQDVCVTTANPVILQLKPSSTVRADPGVSLATGFQRLPQALLPAFDVALATRSLAEEEASIDIVTALARLSSVPLAPRVVSWSSLSSDHRSILAVTTNGTAPPGAATVVSLEENPTQVLVHGKHGIVAGTTSAVAEVLAEPTPDNQSRTMLFLDARSPQALAALATGLATGSLTVSDATANVVTLGTDGTLVQIPVGQTAAPGLDPSARGASSWVLRAAGIVLFALLLAVGLVLSRRRTI